LTKREFTLQEAGASFAGGAASGLLGGGGSGAADLVDTRLLAKALKVGSWSLGSYTGGVAQHLASSPDSNGYSASERLIGTVAGGTLSYFPGARDLMAGGEAPNMLLHIGVAWAV